ncbi:MAG TPA: DsbE family thiol:disulfide interchange protein [Gammaproteobacteria bacterium]|nr:DsbE family thiol:disulfide interchange protein [Gammaproteobacteria bacterium]
MWPYLKFGLPVLVLAALIVLFARGLFLNPTVVSSPLIGKPQPGFSLPRLEGDGQEPFTQTEWQGQVALVNFWGSWCVACRDEHPVLMQFAAEHAVPLYGLDYKDERAVAEDMLSKQGNPYSDIAFDASGDVAINWGVYGAPETFLLDRHGVIRYKYIGPLTPELIRNDLLPRIRSLEGER